MAKTMVLRFCLSGLKDIALFLQYFLSIDPFSSVFCSLCLFYGSVNTFFLHFVLHYLFLFSASSCVVPLPVLTLLGAPTLSRLLEAGPAHFATPLASFSAATSDSPSKSLLTPIESQATIIMMSALPMTAAVPGNSCLGFHACINHFLLFYSLNSYCGMKVYSMLLSWI